MVVNGQAARAGSGRTGWIVPLVLLALVACARAESGDRAALERWYAQVLPVPEAAQLIGLDPPALRRMLGPPDFQRREARAELWRYDLEPCILDLFLHRDLRDERYHVAHAQFRPGRPGVRDCRMPLLAIGATALLERGQPLPERY